MGSNILGVLDKENRSEFLDIGEEFIQVPKLEDIRIKDEAELLMRLDKMQSPSERLKEFFKSQAFFGTEEPTHEAVMIKGMAYAGAAFGWLFGGLARSHDIHESFVRQHNAAVFDSKWRAKREYLATYFYRIIRRGAKFGVGSCLLCTSAGLIGFGSIAYRNKLYFPDYLVGFATVGAISRCWLGLRGVVAGTGFGLAAGTVAFGFAKGAELLCGRTVTEIRYLKHMQYLQKRDEILNRAQKHRAKADKEFISPWI